jgi:hypothetical protein
MLVLVSGLCWAPVIANILNLCGSKGEYKFIPYVSYDPYGELSYNNFLDQLSRCDAWISGIEYKPEKELQGIERKLLFHIKYPTLSFSGFHPDLCYIRNSRTGNSLKLNSKIASWAYKNELSIEDTENLFCDQVFRSLGFYSEFMRAKEDWRARFERAGFTKIEFSEFFKRIQRYGRFMLTINHPDNRVFIEMAKLLSQKLPGAKMNFPKYISIVTGLEGTTQALYPEIGQQLSIEGDYYWQGNDDCIHGLSDFIIDQNGKFQAADTQPCDIEFLDQDLERQMDSVLAAHFL